MWRRNSYESRITAAAKDIAVEHIRRFAYPLKNASDLDPLMDAIGDAQYVLLGEASHGTHEYYTWRAHITKRLIAEKNFSFVAVEGDWPDCYRLNRYIKGYENAGKSAKEVLRSFNRWPTWMWANWETVALAEWMHKFNRGLPVQDRKGFYGLDIYSLFESLDAIIHYLERTDPQALPAAKKVIECFEPYAQLEGQEYAHAVHDLHASCEKEVIHLLSTMREKMRHYNSDHEAVFSLEQNALIAVNAERYYRTMLKGGPASWNIRDRHMAETLTRLVNFHGAPAKTIVWEHNSHVGDARATDMNDHGMINIGQVLREEQGVDHVFSIGFGSYSGTVMAGRHWGDEMRSMSLPPAKEISWESILHQAGHADKLILSHDMEKEKFFFHPLQHRAVGVVYNSEFEKRNNYVPSVIPVRYDAFIYLDQTTSLHPLHLQPDGHQVPETFPWGT